MGFIRSRNADRIWISIVFGSHCAFSMPVGADDVKPAPLVTRVAKESVDVLTQIIQADFDALDNGGQRIGNVLTSGANAHSVDGPAPGFYMLNWDEFEVATEWELLERKTLSQELVEISVRFYVVGRTRGLKAGEAGISKNIDPKNKVITYRVTKGPHGWKLIDPPMPIVGLKSLTEFYMAELQTSSRAMAALEGKGIRQYANLTKVRDIAAMRLHDLEALGKVK